MSAAEIRAGVIGCPVGHSLSPLIHRHWIRRYDIRARYEKIEIPPERLAERIEDLIQQGYAGFNVTIPHKQTIMAFCRKLDETAQQIGAVNTIIIDQSGQLKGMNTDSFGFCQSIVQADISFLLQGRAALVLGAGGAARAVVHGLLQLGVKEIRLANRTRKKAAAIAADFPVTVIDWQMREEAASGAAILVNTTALGMTGQKPLDFDLAQLPQTAAVCDIVYRPLLTPLLRQAQARGHKIITGTGMLLHQARPAFKEWFGVMPEVDEELQQKIYKEAQ